MATKPPLVNLPDPMMVQQQLMQQRQQQWGSGNVAQMHQATVGNALDSLFGNPLVKRAKTIQSRVAEAEKGVFIEEGDDDVTSEMKRLAAIRDAVSDLDPAITSQVTERMLQLQQVRLERDKLKAQTVKEEALTGLAQVRTDKAVVDTGAAINADSRAEEMQPVRLAQVEAATDSSKASAANSRSLVEQRRNERVNMLNTETGHMVTVPMSNGRLREQLAGAGYVEAGKPTFQGSKDDVLGIKPNDRSKQLVKFQETAVTSAKLAAALGDTIKMIDANPQAGTLPGEIVASLRKARENMMATFKANGLETPDLTKEGVSVEQLVNNTLGRADPQLRGMVTTLIYAKAKEAEGSGRLSNQDVEMWAKTFGAYSPQQMRDTTVRLLVQGERDLKIAGGALGALEDQAVKVALEEYSKARESATPIQPGQVDKDGFTRLEGPGNVRMRVKPRQQ